MRVDKEFNRIIICGYDVEPIMIQRCKISKNVQEYKEKIDEAYLNWINFLENKSLNTKVVIVNKKAADRHE
jgi:hypothetical protein